MTKYLYSAKDKEGNIYESTHEAPTRVELYTFIRDEGGTVISVKESKSGISVDSFFAGIFGNIKTHDKILLARNLASMVKAGLSVTRALGVMEKQTKKKKLKILLRDLTADVSHGEPLSEAMKKRPQVFSQLFISMVRAGEESGNIANSLEIVAGQMDKSFALVKKVRGALIYPAVVISAMVLIAILMLIYMVPTLTATFEGLGVKLPVSTRVIIASSDFLVNHTLIVFLGIIALVISAITLFKSAFGQKVMDHVTIRIPVIGAIAKEVQSARTARTLSSLLSSGVDIVVALGVTIDVVQNSLYKKILKKARTAIEKGEPMSLVFIQSENLYPTFVGEMIAVGEETGKISEMLLGVATYYENEVEEKTKDLSTIIEPVLMIVIGIGVGIFAISMLAPTYSLVDNI
ncbi:MAG: general secretion pathway protein F [Parcubacteria bacterium C7867-005]|nr:MAG: general secretion pathway protein F [Parcubacteria bacterium C7867-005]